MIEASVLATPGTTEKAQRTKQRLLRAAERVFGKNGFDRTSIAGPKDGWPVVFLHGNCSDSRFWTATMAALPAGLRGVAPDLRGLGATAPGPIDATRGMRDFADDLEALLDHPEVGVAGRPGALGRALRLAWPAPCL
jgi:pimeloyl-ACP methyl ester carboxylesterase